MIVIISAKGKLLKSGQNRDTVFVIDDEKYAVEAYGGIYVYEKVPADPGSVIPDLTPGKLVLTIPGDSINFKLSMDYDEWYDVNGSIDWDYTLGASPDGINHYKED